jgi:dihydropteroate synthase
MPEEPTEGLTPETGHWKLTTMPSEYSPQILGVLNLSPESMVKESIATSKDAIEARARLLSESGAHWIDLGARSITPDLPTIDDAEEQSRLLPALAQLVRSQHSISVDTWSEATAIAALHAGARAVNFTGGQIGNETLDAIAESSATLFLTFMPYGDAYAMRESEPAQISLDRILDHLAPQIQAARSAGVQEVVIDPNLGIIHAWTDDESKIHQQLEIIWNLEVLRGLGCPILLYAARKPERLARIMIASAIIHARADYIRTHTPEMIERLLNVNA